MRTTITRVIAVLVVIALVVVIAQVWSNRPKPVAAPSSPAPTTAAVPGDPYIARTANAYLAAVIGGDPRSIKRLRQSIVEADVVRAETLGRYASVPASALKVVSVHDEQAFSANGASQPATSWSAIVTMQVTQGSTVETFGVQLTGDYSANGSIDTSQADATAM